MKAEAGAASVVERPIGAAATGTSYVEADDRPVRFTAGAAPALLGLGVAATAIAISALLGLLFTSAVFGYPGGLG